jgi:hypothetical protein
MGRQLVGEELEQHSERMSQAPTVLCNGMYISLARMEAADGSESTDALLLGMELTDGRTVVFALKTGCIDDIIAGMTGAKEALEQMNNAN